MKQEQKNKRVLEIADELHELGYTELAIDLRKLVASKKTTNEQSESNEGDDTGGSQPPPGKERP